MPKPATAVRHARYDLNDRPFIVIWEVTQACDLACKHCRAEAQPLRHPRELDGAEARALMDQVASFGPPPPLFVMTGGDPFKRPDLFELVEYGARIGLPVSVSPSGTPSLTYDNLARLREAGAVALSLSLDGSTAEIHDGFRRVEGVYGWTLAGWRAARQLGFKVQINTTVTPHNLYDLPEILRLVRELGAMTWSLFFLVRTGRGRALDAITPEQFEDVLHFLYDADKVVSLKTTEGHHFRRVVIQRQILERRGIPPSDALVLGETYRELRRRLEAVAPDVDFDGRSPMRRTPLDVNAGRGFVFISHLGVVYPSGFLPLAAGSVRERPLTEIYRQSPLFRSLRDPDRLEGRCGRCEFRAVCGGSRSRAFGATGNALAEEPWCTYEPGSFPFQDELHPYLAASPA
ncbi:TIGR04053 family radical SAM/SPASM domain-containing protein [Carboxydochorda subterranea]|uniref:TIGR04053 family radical SAM/SPASM domain-containing protein n=1 Tax=Carboxydichorda subterranea TaxID=3109565 RepID=A0ABZ1BZ52_9FIRM|nr:TIGR04053 family radical SAM/SPASM domain-containing protein [Limnochorda sp. L945t]WRP17347.1 TIGR04053 family radical SAM/SPASM domain-containing protein [Limnochorda sp. L945t]